DTNTLSDLFVHNVTTGQTTLVTANTNGALETNWVNLPVPFKPAFSADGRYVTYVQDYGKVYFRDLQAGTRTLVSATNQFNFVGSRGSTISQDGRFVAFENGDYSLGANNNIFLYDSVTT